MSRIATFLGTNWKDAVILVLALVLLYVVGSFLYTHRTDHALLHQLVTIEVQRQQAAQKQQQAQPPKATPPPAAAVPSPEK
jgi:uncharacterized membrane protein